MTQRNPIKSEFFTFFVDQSSTQASDQSGAGQYFYAVNTSGAKEVVFSALSVGWYVTNKSFGETFDVIGIRRDAQIMPLPFIDSPGGVRQSTPLVTHTNDDMLYVFLDPDAKLQGNTKCFVWVIR